MRGGGIPQPPPGIVNSVQRLNQNQNVSPPRTIPGPLPPGARPPSPNSMPPPLILPPGAIPPGTVLKTTVIGPPI